MYNIILNKPGVTTEFCETETERDGFELFVTKAIIENIVNYTNKLISKTLEKIGQKVIQTGKYHHVNIVDAAKNQVSFK